MSTSEQDRQAVAAYRVRLLLISMSTHTLRDLINVEREHKRAFGTLAEMAREELAKRGEEA